MTTVTEPGDEALTAARRPLEHIRICDLTGQLAGAGSTKALAALGAEVIRVEDPVRKGRWDILRGAPPFVDSRRGLDLGGGFNNHNTEKKGVTINLRTPRGKALLRDLIRQCDVVAENFAAGVMERLGFGWEELQKIRTDIIYVSHCGFGHTGPYSRYKTWGPIVQAMSGLTFTSGLPEQEPAGWGFSYMDHTGGYYMAIAMLLAIAHRNRTGEGQWVDLSCTEAGATLHGPAILDHSVNGRPMRRAESPESNRQNWPAMAPHGVYPAKGEDRWVAIACRDDADWHACAEVIDLSWARDNRFAERGSRIAKREALDALLADWTRGEEPFALADALAGAGVPAAVVKSPEERIDLDANTAEWELFPVAEHREMGRVRVDGLGVHLSETDWQIDRGAPCLGEHNEQVFGDLLGLSSDEIEEMRAAGDI
ncbi:CoA transferase [Pseudohaliea sp.]|uniref:CaiB/BaiF CoA transferase family protein n=1 Tax=Pseudohaliea sp. TaxID=2740289 RepID=UPI0032F093EE